LATRSSAPASTAPAAFAAATLSDWQKQTTRADLPMPWGSEIEPRMIWSACFYILGMEDGKWPSAHLHQPTYDFNDAAIPHGIEAMVMLALADRG
jgi:metal-dependent amidase/aminoacylase/carboxypeptidase family protein